MRDVIIAHRDAQTNRCEKHEAILGPAGHAIAGKSECAPHGRNLQAFSMSVTINSILHLLPRLNSALKEQ